MKSSILSEDEVKKIASLAKLPLTPAEVKKFQKQLVKILAYFQKLKKINTDNIVIGRTNDDLSNVVREDVTTQERMFTQEQALMNVKKSYKGYFIIDKIIDKE